MGIAVSSRDVLFTGGVPNPTAEENFRILANAVGARAPAYPDGEVGDRRYWISALGRVVWSKVEGLEEIPNPLPEGHPAAGALKSYRLKTGVSRLNLDGLLPYARDAIASYAVFQRLRGEGVIAPGVRFQMSVPAAHDAVAIYFPHPADWPTVMSAWSQHLRAEFRRMLEVIPANDLLIQIDYCTELVHMAGYIHKFANWAPDEPPEKTFTTYTDAHYLSAHVGQLPQDVLLGYHICAGTWPEQPNAELKDLALPVRVANALAANSGRRVDYFHLPVMRESGSQYFKPLADLNVGDAAIYLGLECNDGHEAMQRRIDAAKQTMSGFGVAHYCGYTLQADILPQVLADLATGANYNGRK